MTAFYLRFHGWRGFPLRPEEPDMFHAQVPLGFATLFICKGCLIESLRILRDAMNERIAADAQRIARDEAIKARGWPSESAGVPREFEEGR